MIRRRRHDEAQLFHDAWQGPGPVAAEVEELVRTAEQICAAAVDVEPSTDFRASLRASLMAEAATVLTPVTTPQPDRFVEIATVAPGRGRRRVAGLAIAAVAAAGTVGMISGSANAVPGDALYGVKRSVEHVELSLRQSDESRGAYQLKRAATRLSELQKVSASHGSADAVADLLQDFSDQAEAGSTALFDEYTKDGDRASIEAVNRFTASAATSLGKISTTMPDEAQAPFQQAADTVSDLVNEVAGLCATCTDVDVSRLASAVTSLPKVLSKPTTQHEVVSVAPTRTPSALPTQTPKATTTTAAPKPTLSSTPVAGTVKKVTNPVKSLVGALLGDEKQEGLVPGLVNGLLGLGAKK